MNDRIRLEQKYKQNQSKFIKQATLNYWVVSKLAALFWKICIFDSCLMTPAKVKSSKFSKEWVETIYVHTFETYIFLVGIYLDYLSTCKKGS